jgi:hypothetical protein
LRGMRPASKEGAREPTAKLNAGRWFYGEPRIEARAVGKDDGLRKCVIGNGKPS